jgi:hypothetical protein
MRLRMSMQQEHRRAIAADTQVDDSLGCFDPAVGKSLEHPVSVVHFSRLNQRRGKAAGLRASRSPVVQGREKAD